MKKELSGRHVAVQNHVIYGLTRYFEIRIFLYKKLPFGWVFLIMERIVLGPVVICCLDLYIVESQSVFHSGDTKLCLEKAAHLDS